MKISDFSIDIGIEQKLTKSIAKVYSCKDWEKEKLFYEYYVYCKMTVYQNFIIFLSFLDA